MRGGESMEDELELVYTFKNSHACFFAPIRKRAQHNTDCFDPQKVYKIHFSPLYTFLYLDASCLHKIRDEANI